LVPSVIIFRFFKLDPKRLTGKDTFVKDLKDTQLNQHFENFCRKFKFKKEPSYLGLVAIKKIKSENFKFIFRHIKFNWKFISRSLSN
jgi:hypothetical protein